MKPEEYVWIRKWGEMMGSSDYYIEEQQKLAAQDGAPLNAIYAGHNWPKRWETTADITNVDTRAYLGLPPL